MINQPVISHFQAKKFLAIPKRTYPCTVMTTLDLGMTTIAAEVDKEGVFFSHNCALTWPLIKKISKSQNGCFTIADNTIEKIQFFSDLSNCPFSLMPTISAPTMLVAGKTMHRIVNTDPVKDTEAKIAAISPISGRILDTSTGLGYTAISAAKTAREVVTIEIDTMAQQVAKYNPYSQELFSNSKIIQHIGNSKDVIPTFADCSFDGVIHDPPVFAIAGDLYSADYYSELHRILKNNGKLFHYIGNPQSISGDPITRGVIERLSQKGFKMIKRYPEAFGVIATK